MGRITEQDRQNIRQAIADVELNTSGELVTVVTRASDGYLFIPVLWAALAALLVPFALWALEQSPGPELSYLLQVGVFVSLGMLFRWPPLKMWLIPKAIKQQRSARMAREQFFNLNLHQTSGRTGVLIFVSLAEHYVEIIADKGINDVVPANAWDQAVAKFVQKVKAGQLAAGFITVVNDCGDLLKQYFPAAKDNKNELPNRLIEI